MPQELPTGRRYRGRVISRRQEPVLGEPNIVQGHPMSMQMRGMPHHENAPSAGEFEDAGGAQHPAALDHDENKKALIAVLTAARRGK